MLIFPSLSCRVSAFHSPLIDVCATITYDPITMIMNAKPERAETARFTLFRMSDSPCKLQKLLPRALLQKKNTAGPEFMTGKGDLFRTPAGQLVERFIDKLEMPFIVLPHRAKLEIKTGGGRIPVEDLKIDPAAASVLCPAGD